MTELPLDGLVVVTLEQAVAAPLATRHLADMGARVIKIERPDGGDFARAYDATVQGLSSAFVWLNRSKESMALDLKNPRALEVLDRMLERADVFVQNLAPGAADRLGLGAQRLRSGYPRLIVCGVSGYGADGPYRDKKAYDLLVQAESGLISATGTVDEPAKVGISIADVAAGMYAYSGILAALVGRGRTGEGAVLDISLLEALSEWMNHLLYYTEYGGTQPRRMGVSHPMIAPYGPFDTSDGVTVLLAVQNEREWLAFCDRVLCEPRLAHDERFDSMSHRVANRTALDDLIAAWFAKHGAAEILDLLDDARIASARINDVHGLAQHPQLSERNRWREVGSPVGQLRALLPPAVPLGAEPRMDPVPALGEHTAEVLRWLGYSAGQITAFEGSRLFG